MTPDTQAFPEDVVGLRVALAAERAARQAAEIEARDARAQASGAEAVIAHLKLLIAKLKQEKFGASAERGRKLDQLELQLEEIEANVAEDQAAVRAKTSRDDGAQRSPDRRKPVRGPFPAHLPRERVIIPGPVGACAATLSPLVTLIQEHVLAAARIHGDDTTVPVLAKGRTVTGRLWTYVRDDRPFGGPAPPAAMFFYSRDRGGEHPRRHLARYAGILQADAYTGYTDLYDVARKPGPITEAACWAHGRRYLFKLADLAKAPLAIEAVRRIDVVFAIERDLNGLPMAERLAARARHVAPLVADLEDWMKGERSRLSRHADHRRTANLLLP